jgi:hypothetical protein
MLDKPAKFLYYTGTGSGVFCSPADLGPYRAADSGLVFTTTWQLRKTALDAAFTSLLSRCRRWLWKRKRHAWLTSHPLARLESAKAAT